ELYPNSAVLTLDSDFRIYRKNINKVIPVIMPDIH
ncbi:MAG TPA: pilus assembly protein, partial [Thioploca sp.]|nr:pilus assembly protein [Thioploca sp.]